MQTNENIVALGVGRKGCQVVEQMLGKIENVEFAGVRFQASDEILVLLFRIWQKPLRTQAS